MNRTRTSAYHLMGNGQVERFNRTVKAMLSKMVKENQRDWDSKLPKALFAYRTSIHESTGFTPYHMNFGCTPILPIDVLLGRFPEDQAASYLQFVQYTHSQLRSTYQLARKHLQAAHLQQKKSYDQKCQGEELRVGDRVWMYSPAIKPGHTKKFSSLWRGPYTIMDKTGPVNYRIQLIGGTQTLVVHRNHLKLCYTPPQLNKLVLQRSLHRPVVRLSHPPQQVKPTIPNHLLAFTVTLLLKELKLVAIQALTTWENSIMMIAYKSGITFVHNVTDDHLYVMEI